MLVNINKLCYTVNENEFIKIHHDVYNNLCIRENVGLFERIISLLVELSESLGIKNGLFFEQTHGGFIPINCSSKIKNIYVSNTNESHIKNIKDNIELHKVNNLHLVNNVLDNILND